MIRLNNPPVGSVTPETDPVAPYSQDLRLHRTRAFGHRPWSWTTIHLFDPQLVRAGKKEHRSFDVPTVSLHVHEGFALPRRQRVNGHVSISGNWAVRARPDEPPSLARVHFATIKAEAFLTSTMTAALQELSNFEERSSGTVLDMRSMEVPWFRAQMAKRSRS
jgi:hypothetical protein